jgi:FkbM family methyltransferase
VFLDVGANLGYFSLLAADRVGPRGKVIAIEPDPDNFSLLERSVAHNRLGDIVKAHRLALSDRDGEARLYLSEDNLGDHQVFATGELRNSVPVTLRRGADLLGEAWSRIDLVKIDTQGSEFAVVAGLLPVLTRCRPRLIVELTPLSLRQCGSSGRELIELLAGLHLPFWIVDHIEHRLVASSSEELARWCDNVDAVPDDAGFMNILVGTAPGEVAPAKAAPGT